MFRPITDRRSATLFLVLTVLALFGARRASAQVVETYDFEGGSADGWTSFYNASTPVSTNAASYTGSYSLLTTTSSTGTGGPSVSLTSVLTPGAQYTITGWVQLTPGEDPANANFTIQRSDPSCSGGTCYDTVGNYEVAVTPSGWAEIGGTYTASATATGLLLYAQLIKYSSATSFYLDDVVITETAPPAGETTIANDTFANGSLEGWAPFGSVNLQSGTSPFPDPAGNMSSLLTTNRTAGYMGPSLNLLSVNGVVAGAVYQVTGYVLLTAPDSANPTVTLSTKTTNCANGSGIYANTGTPGLLSSAAWTKVSGTFSFSNLPGPPTSLTLYLQSSSATDSFYLSDVTITQIAAPPLPPSDQDNSGITTTFADGGLDGWTSRSGASTLTNVTAPAPDPNGDTHALLTTGRIGNWDGPQISVSDKMYTGSVYNISAYVMMQPTDQSSHVINMSLVTTLNGNTSYPSVTSYPGITVPADGQWHPISVLGYTMSSSYDAGEASLYFQTVPSSGNDLAGFYISDFQLSYVLPPTIQTDIPSVYKTYSQDFPIGAEIDPTDLSGPHAQLLQMHFNSITSGNDFKWSSTEPSLGNYTWGTADSEVGEAVCHNQLVRGQNLVWATGAQTPSYAFGDRTSSAANQATVAANIQEHIQSEVQHFGTNVYAWDVVNEPIDPSQSDCLEHGPFYNVLGATYLDVAFKAAKQYAPAGTKLFLNDYSTTDPAKLACLVKVLGELQARGVPVDGVGHEMHNAINYPSVKMMATAIDTVARDFPGIDQQVTELDMSVYNAGDTTSNYGQNVPPPVLAEQGWLYKQYFDLFRSRRHELSAVTFWGMADDDTWLDGFPVARTDYPLPFNMQLQAKPAYWGIVDATQLPGYGLHFDLSSAKGTAPYTRVLTLTGTDGDVGPAFATQISSLALQQIGGSWCQPAVTGTLPAVLGDIATSGNASASFTVDFSHCSGLGIFLVTAPWNSAVYDTGTFVQLLEVPGLPPGALW